MTTVYMTVDYMTVADTILAPINEQLITFVYSFHLCLYSLLQTLSCVLLCYSEPEDSCLWPSKYIQDYWYLAPLAGLHMQVYKLIIDPLRNVTSYTALFQCIVMIIAIFSDFAFKIPSFVTPLKS